MTAAAGITAGWEATGWMADDGITTGPAGWTLAAVTAGFSNDWGGMG
jgi:hypothetical protein